MTTTTRVAPTGTFQDDGFSTKIAFAADDNVTFWERTVKPPGWDGGDAIDTTTMFNSTYRTMAPRSLISGTAVTGTAAYDPKVLSEIIALLNVNGWITIHHPNTDTWDFVGFLRLFDPNENTEGEFPLASFEVIVSNTLAGVETAPVFTENSTP
jgi:hypothetical protein